MPDGALSDITVLETGQLIAGPFCGQMLGDFGATVIKAEDPQGGDPLRRWGRMKDGQSMWWPTLARNKRSVTLNLRHREGQALAREIAAKADVMIENFRPGTMEKWGLGRDTLEAANPGLVMVRVSGYGQTGPNKDRAGFGAVGEAIGGIRHVTGYPDRPPSRSGVSIGDSLTGLFATIGALTALHARSRTGRGQMVDVALYESVLAVMEGLISNYDLDGYVQPRTGAVLAGAAPSNAYPTSDGKLVLIAGNKDQIYARLMAAIGDPDRAVDPRFATHVERGKRMEEVDDHIAAWTVQRSAADVLRVMEEHAIPSGPINTAAEMLADPHFRARDAIVEVDDPTYGRMKTHGVFPKLSATPGAFAWTGPALGEHNEQVYGEWLGHSTRELSDWRERGVI